MEKKGPVDLSTAKVISDTFFVSVSRIFVLALKPIRGLVLGRLLGPSLYGLLNIPAPYINIFVILSNIGFNTAVVKLIPGYRQKNRGDLSRMIYRSAAALTIVLSIIWCVLIIVYDPWIAKRIAHEPDAVVPIRIGALIIPFLALNLYYGAVYLAVQRGKLRALITLAHGSLHLCLPIAAILWKQEIVPVLIGFLVAEILGTFLFAIFFHRRIVSGISKTVGPLVRGIREVTGFGISFFFANLGWNMINSVDKLMVKYFLPLEHYGFYSMASLIITSLSVVASTWGVALVPSLTVARDSGDHELFKRQIDNTSRLGFLVLVPATAVIFVLIGDVMSVFLPKFEPAVSVIRILVFVGFILMFCRTGWAALVSYNRGGAASTAYIIAAASNIILNRILIPLYGIEGAAIATLSSYVILALIFQAMMHRITRMRVSLKNFVHPLVISLVFPLIGLPLGGFGPIQRIIIVVVAGSVVYALLSLVTGLVGKSDIAAVREAIEHRSHVFHVRLALLCLKLLDAVNSRIGKHRN